jgi:intraflagellar transport protein 74
MKPQPGTQPPQGQRGTTALRQGTAYKGELPVNLNTAANLNLTNRPVTQQGLSGVKTAMTGTKRQIYDRSYYLNQLKQKSYELAAEINMFKKRAEEIDKEHNLFGQLQTKYQELSKEVLSMEGTLADYNLAADRQRSRAKPEDIKSVYVHLKYQNDRYREQLDELFIERKKQEEEIAEIEQELREMAETAALKVNELDVEQKKEYDKLQAEKALVVADLHRSKMELEELENKVDDQIKRLKMDQNRVRVMDLKEQLSGLEAQRQELEVLNDESNMSVPELMDRLFQKIKNHKLVINEMEARTRELRKAVDNNNRKLKEMESEISGGNQVTEESKQKYEALFAKEQQLDKFIEGYPKARQKEIEEMNQKQQSIVQYLDNISQSVNLIRHAPDPDMVAKVNEEFKNRQKNKQDSEATLELVQNQYQTRLQDMERIKSIQETAPQKITALKERLTTMKADMQKFKNAEEVKKEMYEKRKRLIEKTQKLQELTSEYRRKLGDQEENFKKAKQALSSHPKYTGFMELEKKISQTEQTINNWKSNIALRLQDIDPEPFSKACKTVATEINRILCK